MSLEFLNAFKFQQKDTFIHNLDPRSKLLLAIIYTIVAILFTEIIPLTLIFISLLPLILAGHLLKQWFKSIKGLTFLFVLIIVLNTFFISLSFAIAMILRIMIMMSAFSIFFLTVHPDDLALSLVSMKIKYEIAFSFSLAFRFVPTIAIEAQNIIDAQQSRGYELKQSGLIKQIKNLFPLLIPLITCSIRRAFNVAEALESRAFGSNKNRTFFFTIKYSLKDWVITMYLLIFLIIVIFIKFNFHIMPVWFSWSFPV
jgi:energy-coupling factor transport system permease protein